VPGIVALINKDIEPIFFFLFFGFALLLKFVKICQKFKAQSLVRHMRARVLTNVSVRSPLLADKMSRFKND
jgi:hypothetical protein